MKRKLKNLLLLTVFSVIILIGSALITSAAYWDYCGDDVIYTYYESTGEVVISGSGDMWDYGYDTSPFTIEKGDNRNIKKVTIKSGVTSIGEDAFYRCLTLETVSIPSSVTYIDSGAFLECDKLKKITVNSANKYYSTDSYGVLYDKAKTYLIQYPVGSSTTTYTIPATVEDIDYLAFNRCANLATIKVNSGNKYYSNDSYGVLFDKDKEILIQYPVGNSRTSYTIPDTVYDIYDWSFELCDALQSVTIPESVYDIEDGAFCECTALESVEMPDYLEYIGSWAFSGCSKLRTIAIPYGIEEIYNDTFSNCTRLTQVTFPVSLYDIDYEAFYNCNNIREILYEGTWDDWDYIDGVYDNDYLSSAEIFVIPDVDYEAYASGVYLYWDDVYDVDEPVGYAVYQKVAGSWKLLKTTYDTECDITNLAPDSNYIFAVRAFIKDAPNDIYWAERYATQKVRTAKFINENLYATPYADKITLSWETNDEAWGYRVFMKTSSGWKALKTLAGDEYTVTGLKASTNYTFAVRAYMKVNGAVVWASKYPVITTSTSLGKLTLKVASNAKGTSTIVWSKANGATGYQVWYTTDYMNSYRKLGNYTGTSTYHRSLPSGTTYYYRVRAYKAVGSSYVYSPWSSVVSTVVK